MNSKATPIFPDAVQFFATATYPCSYLENMRARAQLAMSFLPLSSTQYSALVGAGFRRNGIYIYRPYCDQCTACVPLRIAVRDFKPSRSQHRAAIKHRHLKVYECDLSFRQEHFDLYEKYQNHRHAGGGMDQPTRDDYEANILQSPYQTRLIEFRETDHSGGPEVLRMVAIVDVLNDGFSAVYTFFDPASNRTDYGTYAILWQIQQALLRGLHYVYLGYWVGESPKMRYKSRFKPHEILRQGAWRKIGG